ncbi:host specificity factor TipJ family phage tail protein [Methylobacillus flagellatus]|uniref:Phage-related protein tail component-like protein n=1 Tax=Methylobacillus flagellatus (strain ATCC 51484 / DSM 6875 / VKM B-1610 / KT) TaxID=265072 RepID=Q1GXT9_METFK|nr:host specificity factor TipJ family phage tail protein [Methylobacillus flagellatus]ABE50948.1 Phage-related protein tail component-like protein [Methylobacillus flagellatus KT]
MKATVITVRNPFAPAQNRTVTEIRRRRRIAALAPQTAMPFICHLNGKPLLRPQWSRCVEDGDIVIFSILVRGGGGGGSNPLRIVMMVAVMYVTGGLGGTMGAMGGVGGMVATGATATMINIAVGMVGMAVINAVLPVTNTPASMKMQSLAAPSPTYSIGSQGNQARLGQPIPKIYGRHKVYPDLAAMPYTEYAGNEQYLYQLFCVGLGEYELEALRMEESPIENFPEVTVEIVQPGELVTLFPTNVYTAPEVAGQELENTWTGGFPACGASQQLNAIAVDIVAPRGLYYANDQGGLTARSVTVAVEARLIDTDGNPLDEWQTLGVETFSAASQTVIRNSYRYEVTPGRYEVRVQRSSGKDTSSRAANDVTWTALRGYMPGNQSYGNVTMVAIRMRATNSLSSQSSRRFNLIATSKLRVWNGVAWSAPVATRSIAWAIADALMASYGGKLPQKRIDLDGLLSLDQTWAARGDTFNGVFDTQNTLFDAVKNIALVGRAQPYQQGGIWYVWRDQPQAMPVGLFNARNIIKGSFKTQYLLPTEQTADALVIPYWDEETWSEKTVTCQLDESAPGNPKEIPRVFGMTTRKQVWQHGMYTLANNRYRRELSTLTTEMDGFIPTYGDMLAIAAARDVGQYSGDVMEYDAVSRTITTSEPLTWSTGGANHFFAFRRRNGDYDGPYRATPGATDYEAVLDTPLDFTPDTGTDRERTSYRFGVGQPRMMLARGIRPRSRDRVEISLVIEAPEVHTADSGLPPETPSDWNLPVQVSRPAVSGLTVLPGGTPDMPMAQANWVPSPGAEYYVVEVSYDDGDSWQPVGQPTNNSITFPVRPGIIQVAISAVGQAQGLRTVWTGAPFSNAAALPSVTGLILAQPFVGRSAKWLWNPVVGNVTYTVTIYAGAGLTLKRTVQNLKQPEFEYTYEDAIADGGPWRILRIGVRAYSIDSASEATTYLNAENPQVAAPTGLSITAGPGALTVNVNPPADTDVAGMMIWMSAISGFTPSLDTLVYDGPGFSRGFGGLGAGVPQYFRVALYDTFGKDSLNISSEITASPIALGGVPQSMDIPDSNMGDIVYVINEQSLYQWKGDAIGYERAQPAVIGNQIIGGIIQAAIELQAAHITGGSLNINNRFKVDSGGDLDLVGPDGTVGLALEQSSRLVVRSPSGARRVLIGKWSAT